MNEADRHYLALLADWIESLRHGGWSAAPRPANALSPELERLTEELDRLFEDLTALRGFGIALGNGDLDFEPRRGVRLLDPLKPLQSNLRHLTWQAQRVAAGDLNQRVDFLGEFSTSFNRMIQALREQRLAEERVRYLSEHDTLTGLNNRAFFENELDRLHAENAYPVSFIMADLDDLKTINDTLGHRVGDLLIQKAAQIIQNGLGAQDSLARIGGDEFAAILRQTDRTQAQAAIARIRATQDASNRRGSELPVSISLGSGTAGSRAGLDQALRQADIAMYEDKNHHKAPPETTRFGMDLYNGRP